MTTKKYNFAVASRVTAEANFKTGKSRMISCDVKLFAEPSIESSWRDKNGELNKEGLKAQTQGLIQGLIANIHYAHQMGLWDSAEHLRYIIDNLERGFAVSSVEALKRKC